MRVRFGVDEESATIRLELEGIPLSGEFLSFASAIAEHSGFEPGMHVLIDARALRAYPSDTELAELAGIYRMLWLTGMIGCTAIVVQRDGHRAARTFQIHSGDGDPRLGLFRNPDEATRWLDRVEAGVPTVEAIAFG